MRSVYPQIANIFQPTSVLVWLTWWRQWHAHCRNFECCTEAARHRLRLLAGAPKHPISDAKGVAHRCEMMGGGDFFRLVPKDADAYIPMSIIHDWGDKSSVTMLKNCREAIATDGKPPGD
jgi:hypothetical protein